MAVFSAIFSFSNEACITASLNAAASSAAITIGKERKFAIVANGAFNLNMGMAATVPAADAGDFQFPSGQVFTLATNTAADSVRIYNPNVGAIVYYIQPLAS